MAKTRVINLLPQEEFDVSVVGRILKWAMGTFRIIVIITEMIVMGAFLSRFWLDARNSDLNDLIEVKSAQISLQSEFEKEFRGLQTKLNIIEEVSKNTKSSEVLSRVSSKLPPDASFSSLSFQESSAQIKGVAGGEIAIMQFILNLDADEFFKEVSLGQVSQSENNPALTVFAINIKY